MSKRVTKYTKAVAALTNIHTRCGAVCNTYEICEHAACNSSYTAWAIADEALRELGVLKESDSADV